ncbi:MAG TPA: FtsX-like permease family protein [Bacteroidales bacterium]|nr:FtsX-like permease family protein [Bacteroidales bacterium]
MILLTAWKNVWRNKSRSLVVITSITIGIFAGIFAVGLMNGTMEQRVDAALNQEISHIQINQKEFTDNYNIKLLIDNKNQLKQMINNVDGVEATTLRTLITGIANTATKSTGVQIIGVNPENEKQVFNLHSKTIAGTGSYFEKETRYNQAYIGEELAKELNIIRYRIDNKMIDRLRKQEVPEETISKLEPFIGERFPSQKAFSRTIEKALSEKETANYGHIILDAAWSFRERSKLTLTFVDKNNIQTGAMFRISGIFDVSNSMFEKRNVFIRNEVLKNLTGIEPDKTHQAIIKIADRDQSKEITGKLEAMFPDYQTRHWKELSPDLAMMTGMIEKFNIVFLIIILAALSFGIINTMLMVVLERTKELGMLTAIGMNKRRVFSMIMAESVFLSLVGGVVGIIVSKIMLLFTANTGINFASAAQGLEEMGFSSHIYPTISNTFFITVTILVIITGMLSSIYPAIKALRLDPSDALRTE